MKIGIDISQVAYEKTGVANYLGNLVENFLRVDSKNEYILFFSSLRRNFTLSNLNPQSSPRVQIKTYKFPPIFLDILWNRLHIVPIEWLIGDIDIFITSDWTEPPAIKAIKATILYDLIVYKYPEETHNQWRFHAKNMRIAANIVASQKRRLQWVTKESSMIFCISKATKNDAMEILNIPEERLRVAYPGRFI